MDFWLELPIRSGLRAFFRAVRKSGSPGFASMKYLAMPILERIIWIKPIATKGGYR